MSQFDERYGPRARSALAHCRLRRAGRHASGASLLLVTAAELSLCCHCAIAESVSSTAEVARMSRETPPGRV